MARKRKPRRQKKAGDESRYPWIGEKRQTDHGQAKHGNLLSGANSQVEYRTPLCSGVDIFSIVIYVSIIFP